MVRRKQLVGEIVKLTDSYRIYGEDGLYYMTRNGLEALKIAHALLKGEEVILTN